MYRDNSLVPLEAMRTAALGALADRPMRYADVAADIRRFTSRIVGPSLDLMGSSVELLRAEGLIGTAPGIAASDPDPLLAPTATGLLELHRLLCAGVKATSSDLSRLVVALKMRFLHLLPPPDRQDQVTLLHQLTDSERARYLDLATEGSVLFGDWVDFEIRMLNQRLAWLDEFAARCREA